MSRATRERDPEAPDPEDATPAVAAARRGFRRDVATLVAALRTAKLMVPLARRIEDVPLGVEQLVDDELSLSPHLLFDEDRVGFLPIFTRGELVEEATRRVGWTTGDGPLEFCTLPGPVVLELALAIIDDERVGGLIVNPFAPTELLLRRHEVGSIAQGRPLPLVGYVDGIPLGEDEQRLVADMGEPPPADVVLAIEQVLATDAPGATPVLRRTFNQERDLEPHLTLNVVGAPAGADRGAIAERLASSLDGLLPPPGYIDILFDDPTLR